VQDGRHAEDPDKYRDLIPGGMALIVLAAIVFVGMVVVLILLNPWTWAT
jgi:hypothetical protein